MRTPIPRRLTRIARVAAAGAALLAANAVTPALTTADAMDGARAPERASGTTTADIPLAHAPLVRGARDAVAARAVHTDRPFTMFGVTWRGAAPQHLQVRHAVPGGWSAWEDLDEVVPPNPVGSAQPVTHGSEPVWTGGTSDVQVRAARGGADVASELNVVAITTVPQAAATDATYRPGRPPTGTADPQKAPMPKIVTRAQWGADERQMTWPPQSMQTTKAAIVHHTVDGERVPCDKSAEAVRGIYRYQAVDLHWGDIGYHAVVDHCGTIFEGRTNGLQRNVVGGHTAGFNQDTFGIAILGNYDNEKPTQKTLDGVAALAAWKLDTNNVRVDGKTELTSQGGNTNRYPAGTKVTLPNIFAHRDTGNTHCPGENAYQQLDSIRQRATNIQNSNGAGGGDEEP